MIPKGFDEPLSYLDAVSGILWYLIRGLGLLVVAYLFAVLFLAL